MNIILNKLMEYQQIYTRYTIQGTHTLHCLMQEIMPATDHLHHMPLFTGTPPAAATLARDFHRVTAIASITASVPLPHGHPTTIIIMPI